MLDSIRRSRESALRYLDECKHSSQYDKHVASIHEKMRLRYYQAVLPEQYELSSFNPCKFCNGEGRDLMGQLLDSLRSAMDRSNEAEKSAKTVKKVSSMVRTFLSHE